MEYVDTTGQGSKWSKEGRTKERMFESHKKKVGGRGVYVLLIFPDLLSLHPNSH